LVVRTLGGDRHKVGGGSGWTTAVDLRQFVAKAVPSLRELGGAADADSVDVDPNL
jgi:hypothetical protein